MPNESVNDTIVDVLRTALGVDKDWVESTIEVPGDRKMGDLALPCFKLAKEKRKAPAQIAKEASDSLPQELPKGVDRIEAVGPYLNVFFDPKSQARDLLESILENGDRFGSSAVGSGKKVVLDFSSPNIAKPFGVGHLRSTVIGHSVANILNFQGYECIRINHFGDWGTQFGKLMVAYIEWGDEVDLEGNDPIQGLLQLYVKFHKLAEEDPSWDDRGREWFKKLEDGDEEALRLWTWFKEISLKEFDRIYTRLGVEFDSYSGEAFYNDKMVRVIQRLEEKNLLEESRGAKIVDLEEYGLTPVLIQRSDDATLYATRDLAAAYYRHDTYEFHKNLYFVASAQNDHFKQVFKVLELLGEPWAKDCEHVPFGLISFADGMMSTRRGKVVFLEDVLDQAVERVDKIISEKNPALNNRAEVAEQVGVGAIVFYDLTRRRIKDWTFDWDRILTFEGETGPYAMYSHARFRSILRKAKQRGLEPHTTIDEIQFDALDNDEAKSLLQALEEFPDQIRRAGEQYEPSLVTQSVLEVADKANKFYNAHHVLVDEEDISRTRLLLVHAVATVLKTGLTLLGVAAPEEM